MAIKKTKISVILPEKAFVEIRTTMVNEGYSMREKSKWYCEAIETFLRYADFPSYVSMAALVEELSRIETLYIPLELNERLEDAIIEVRKQYPALEGVKSLIVRASIIQRLLQSLPKVSEQQQSEKF